MLVLLTAFVSIAMAEESYSSSYRAPADQKPLYISDGRIKVQVYRGPNKEYGKGSNADTFVPWGFYVTQPEDNKAYGKGY